MADRDVPVTTFRHREGVETRITISQTGRTIESACPLRVFVRNLPRVKLIV